MEEINKGDRVRLTVGKATAEGTVTAVNSDGTYDIEAEGGIVPGIGLSDIELVARYDVRTDFLTRLGSLLEEFDATINAEVECEEVYRLRLGFIIPGRHYIGYTTDSPEVDIDASRLFDFDGR